MSPDPQPAQLSALWDACVPVIPAPWTPGSPTVMVHGTPALTSDSRCVCAWAGQISITGPDSDPARINSILVHGGIAVSRLTVEQPSLEDLFLEITDSEMLQECASR